jgi:hypothetical protein
MNPLALGLPLALPTLAAASHVASGGLGFLQSLLSPAKPASQSSSSKGDTELVSFQQSVAENLRRGGFGAAFPLELADNGQGGLSVLSDSPSRPAMEQRLNSDPFIMRQFRSLAAGAASLFRVTIPGGTGVDASV